MICKPAPGYYKLCSINLFSNTLHELSVTRNIIEIALQKAAEAGAKKISSIDVVIGELSSIEPDCVSFYYEILKKDYGLENTSLVYRRVAALLKCRECKKEFLGAEMPWACPYCESFNLEIKKGSECYVESIEVDT